MYLKIYESHFYKDLKAFRGFKRMQKRNCIYNGCISIAVKYVLGGITVIVPVLQCSIVQEGGATYNRSRVP